EESLWRSRNEPVPGNGDERFVPSPWDERGVDAAIDACLDEDLKRMMRALPTLETRAAEVLVLRNYKPTLFSSMPHLYRDRFGRRPRLDLPFRREDFRGAWLPD